MKNLGEIWEGKIVDNFKAVALVGTTRGAQLE